MNKKALMLISLICILFGVNSSFGVAYLNKQSNMRIIGNNNQQGYSLFVPSGLSTDAVLATNINSKTAVQGQEISAILLDDLKYNNVIIASKESIIKGSIVLDKKKSVDDVPLAKVIFTKIITPYNNLIPINANLVYENSTSIDSIKSNTMINIIFNQPITLGVQ